VLASRLYELWQPHEAYPVTDLCFDPSRNILYAVTQFRSDHSSATRLGPHSHERTYVHHYSLGENGAAAPAYSGPSRLDHILRGQSGEHGAVIAVHPVMERESDPRNPSHCVLVTDRGMRLYLQLSGNSLTLTNLRPRAPPPVEQLLMLKDRSGGVKDSEGRELRAHVQTSYYRDGILILGMQGAIVCIVQDRYYPERPEVFTVVALPPDANGMPVPSWQIGEVRTRSRAGSIIAPGDMVEKPMQSTNELWTQHLIQPRRFMCLGGNGTLVVHRRQPWEKMELACKQFGMLQVHVPLDLNLTRKVARFTCA
jgi:hypothetical protein